MRSSRNPQAKMLHLNWPLVYLSQIKMFSVLTQHIFLSRQYFLIFCLQLYCVKFYNDSTKGGVHKIQQFGGVEVLYLDLLSLVVIFSKNLLLRLLLFYVQLSASCNINFIPHINIFISFQKFHILYFVYFFQLQNFYHISL